MATKRQPSKQRRQTQNQRERAAREARRQNAGAATEVSARQAEEAASKEKPSSRAKATRGKRGASTAAVAAATAGASAGTSVPKTGGGGSALSRLRGASATGRAIRTGTPVGTAAPPGHRAALAALMAAVAGALVGAFMISVPVDHTGDAITSSAALVGEYTLSASAAADTLPAGATADDVVKAVDDWTPNGEERYGVATWPLSLLLLLPVAAAALAFQAVAKRKSSKVVMGAMYATLFGALLSQQLIIFIPTVIGVGIASYQVRKAEAAATFAKQVMDGGDGDGDDDDFDDDDIIDVEEAIDADVEDGQRSV